MTDLLVDVPAVEYGARVVGKQPVPKGSMIVRVLHNGRPSKLPPGWKAFVTEDNGASLKNWRGSVKKAGEVIAGKTAGMLAEGPVSVQVTFTVPRPRTVTVEQRPWPWKRCGDVDKLVRTVFDALTDSGVWGDDSQACELITRKCYPDTPNCPDRLDQPGAVIRLWRTS